MAKNDMKKEKECSCGCCGGLHQFVSIPASLSGIFLVLAVVFIIFARDQLGLLVPLFWGMVVLGIFALLFNFAAIKRKDR